MKIRLTFAEFNYSLVTEKRDAGTSPACQQINFTI